MRAYSKYYGKGKSVKLKDGSDRTVGIIHFADHRNDRYQIMWKRPGGERWLSLHSRMALVPFGEN